MKQYSAALNNRNVPHKSEVVTGLGILEQDGILALHHEACNVEGSEAHPRVIVGRIVSASREMVQAGGNINDQVAVDEDLQLADTVIEVV